MKGNNMKIWTCPHHFETFAENEFCHLCIKDMKNRPDPKFMTGQERAEEIVYWTVLTVPFSQLAMRIDALTNRTHYTHEFADKNRLIMQAKNWDKPILDKHYP